jgi:hypothetical protein
MTDLEAECNRQKKKTPSPRQVADLEQRLLALATLAEQQNFDHEATMFSDYKSLDLVSRSFSNSTDGSPDWSSGDITTTSISETSCMTLNLNSPLEFLRAVFPHMDAARLRSVLARNGDNEIDMEAIVEELLTNEYLLEVEERDLDADTTAREHTIPWAMVERKKQNVPKLAPVRVAQTTRKSIIRPAKIVITDVRQKQNHHRSPRSPSNARPPAAPDPWSQTMSLAMHLSTLLPLQPTSYFQSAFHSPQHSSPFMALRSCLISIANTQRATNADIYTVENTQLFELFDILHSSPIYFQLDPEQRDQVLSDARLALRATGNNPDQALEIVEILFDLDTELDIGIYHSPVPRSPESPTPKSLLYPSRFSSSPSPISAPPVLKTTFDSPSTSSSKSQLSTFAWQSVPQRRVVQEQNFLAESIPAYKSGRKTGVKGRGIGIGKGGKGDVGELTHLEKISQLQKSRREVLQEATRYWKKGSRGNRGGDVAMYFAERVSRLAFLRFRTMSDMNLMTRLGTSKCWLTRNLWRLLVIW